MKKIIARWQDWSCETIEHLVLNQSRNRIIVDAAVFGPGKPNPFAITYHIVSDTCWRANRVEIRELGSSLTIELASDGVGNWIDKTGTRLPQLTAAIDVDISITPFTNTLPIRRLNLQGGQSKEIIAAYIQVPSLTVTKDRQRYTCLVPGKVYRYESVDNDFTRDIEIDSDGLVVNYPGLFRRIL